MKKYLLTLLLAVTVVALSVKLAYQVKSTAMNTDNGKSTIDNIMSRTSIRKYRDKQVEDEKITAILKAAMAAPTAANKQPWQFIVIKKQNVRQQLATALPYAKMVAQAPLAIVVCGDMSKAMKDEEQPFWIQDASAASENILLAAHSLGLGAVWTGLYPLHDRVRAVQQILHLPQSVIPLNLIPIGYPAENTIPKDKWKEGNIHHESWE